MRFTVKQLWFVYAVVLGMYFSGAKANAIEELTVYTRLPESPRFSEQGKIILSRSNFPLFDISASNRWLIGWEGFTPLLDEPYLVIPHPIEPVGIIGWNQGEEEIAYADNYEEESLISLYKPGQSDSLRTFKSPHTPIYSIGFSQTNYLIYSYPKTANTRTLVSVKAESDRLNVVDEMDTVFSSITAQRMLESRVFFNASHQSELHLYEVALQDGIFNQPQRITVTPNGPDRLLAASSDGNTLVVNAMNALTLLKRGQYGWETVPTVTEPLELGDRVKISQDGKTLVIAKLRYNQTPLGFDYDLFTWIETPQGWQRNPLTPADLPVPQGDYVLSQDGWIVYVRKLGSSAVERFEGYR